MDITTKSRSELRAYFVRNAIPTEANFRDLIDGALNFKDDGIAKSAGRPLAIESGATADQPAIHFYESFASAQSPSWAISLLPGMVSGPKTIGRGFGVSSGVSGSKPRLFIDEASGNVGIGTVDPGAYLLNLAGSLNATGTITASGGISIPAGQPFATSGPFNASAGATVSGGPLVASAGINIASGQLLSAGGPINATAGMTVSGAPLHASAGLNVSGTALIASSGLSVAPGTATNIGGALNANGGLSVAPGTTTNIGGALNANGGLSVAAGTTTNIGGALNANGGLSVANGTTTTIGGVLNANSGLNVAPGTTANFGGALNANGGLTVAPGQVLTAGGPLISNGVHNANGGLTVGTAANNQTASLYGNLAVTGATFTAELTVGNAAAPKPLTVNGPLSTTQLATLSGGAAISGELTFSGNANFNESNIYLRSKPDRSHGLGYHGGAKPFQGKNVEGPVLFGYSGGAIGTTAPPFVGVDGAVSFDGVNGFVQLPPINFDWSGGYTIEAAVFFNSFNNWSRVFDFGNGAAGDNVLLANLGSTNDMALSSLLGGADKQVVAKGVLQLGVWMHLCGTMDAAGKVVLYVNGVAIGSGQSQVPRNVVRNNCYFGRSNWAGDRYFNGKLANIRIWQRPLSAQEVVDNMNQTRPFLTAGSLSPWVTGLAGFWPLNETSGQTARDVSGKNNHGTLQNGAVFEGTQRIALSWDAQSNVTVQNNGLLTARMRPAVQTFTVYGDWGRWYPILFYDDGWDDGTLELTLSRCATNLDSSLRGSMICVIRAHSTDWGNDCQFWRITEHYYQFQSAPFVGGVSNSTRSKHLIVWLRGGGTTYKWSSNHAARLIDCTPLDSRVMPFGTNPADTETYNSKTAPDANVGGVFG